MPVVRHRLTANGLTHHVVDTTPEARIKGIVACLHGFPDDHRVWDAITPLITAAGYRVIAPDLRGFGMTGMADRTGGYDLFTGAMPDVAAIMDQLGLERAHLVGHDFGAALAWLLAAQHGDRFTTLTALAVGHQRSFLRARLSPAQMRMSRYILWHQLPGLCEWAYRRRDWAWFRRHWVGHPDIDGAIENLSRPGRLTAGLNWYRANISLARMVMSRKPGAFGEEIVRIPALGVWSEKDRYLGEAQMTGSADFIDAPWRYERLDDLGHWMQAEAPERVAALMLEHWRTHDL